jgi:uncharacterized membrane protein
MNTLIKRFGPASLALLAGVVVLLPILIWGVPNNPDLTNHYRFALPFYESLQRGNLHPGWLASPNLGFGETAVRFYPPALYYLLAAGRMLTGNWYAGSLLVLTLVSALGSLGAYFWARSFVSQRLAICAGLLYAVMPYHLAEVYQAAQLAEFAAGAALLFSLAFAKRLCDHGRTRDLAGLAAAYALLILSHLPMAIFGSITLLVYALMSISRDRARKTLLQLATAVGLGLFASAFYWNTLAVELKWIIASGSSPDPMLDYRSNFIFSTFSAEKSETIWWMGLLFIATVMMILPSMIVMLKRCAPSNRRSLISVFVIVLLSLTMCTVISKPLWIGIPYLQLTQHPFRWLAVASTAAPILMAASIPFWAERLNRPRRAIALTMVGLVLIAVSFTISQTVRGATFLPRPTFDQKLESLSNAPGLIHWLPVWAAARAEGKPSYEKCPPLSSDPARVEAGGRDVTIDEWSDQHRTFRIAAGAAVQARIRTFYYPHWIATANGRVLETRPDDQGTLLVSLPAEAVTVHLDFREPRRVVVAGFMSMGGWFLIALLMFRPSWRRAK